MDLRNTDQELTRTLFTLQTKIRDLKNKINQDEADDDDDDSEKTDYPSSWSSNGHRTDSFSTPGSQKKKDVNIIKEEENEEEPVMEDKQVIQLNTAVTVTRTAITEVNAVNPVNVTAVNGNSTHGNLINGTAVNHNAEGYSRNTNNSLDQTVRPPVSQRKSVTSDGLKNYSNLEKPNLPPPPPPPVSASPTPSLKSTSSSEVVNRFALMKEESKRDSMSSSSFVSSSSSSFMSSLEELRLPDVSRDLRSSGRSFDRMTFEEEEEESEDMVHHEGEDISMKDNELDIDDNGNEETTSDDTTEASKLMDSIWAEVAMFS